MTWVIYVTKHKLNSLQLAYIQWLNKSNSKPLMLQMENDVLKHDNKGNRSVKWDYAIWTLAL